MAHLALADFSDDELDEGDDIVVTDGAIVPQARSLTMSMPSTEMARPAISLSRTGLRLAQDYEGGSPMQPAMQSTGTGAAFIMNRPGSTRRVSQPHQRLKLSLLGFPAPLLSLLSSLSTLALIHSRCRRPRLQTQSARHPRSAILMYRRPRAPLQRARLGSPTSTSSKGLLASSGVPSAAIATTAASAARERATCSPAARAEGTRRRPTTCSSAGLRRNLAMTIMATDRKRRALRKGP